MKKIRPVIFLLLSVILFVIGVVTVLFFDKPVTIQELSGPIANALEVELSAADEEAVQLINHPDDNKIWSRVSHSFYLVNITGVKAWSKNDFVPDYRQAFEPFSIKLLKVANGDFLLKKWPVRTESFLILVIPLRKNFAVVNDYLSPEWNQSIFKVPVEVHELSEKKGVRVCLPGVGCVFSISLGAATPAESFHHVAFLLFLSAILSLVVYAFELLRTLHARGDYQGTFLRLTVFLSVLRIAMVELNFPNALAKFHLFDPQQFASSSFNASIGDLFLNSCVVLIVCLYLFNYYPRFNITRRALQAHRGRQAAMSVACLFICFLALLFPYLYIEIIYHNSSLSLEITQSLRFEATRVFAFVSLITGCINSFLITHILIKLAVRLQRNARYPFFPLLACSAILFLLFFLATNRSYWIPLGLGTVYFLLFSMTNLPTPVSRLTFKVFLYFSIAVIAFSLQSALAVRKFHEEKKIKDLFRYGNKFLVEQDVLTEYLLNESAQKIAKDPFIQLRLFTPFLSKASVRQKIKLIYLNSYFDRYDIQVYLYNAKGAPVDNYNGVDFKKAVENYEKDAYKTIYKDIYFINNPSPEATKKYLVIIPFNRFRGVSGYIVLDLILKKIIPQNVYPELLVDNRFNQYVGNHDFSYAFYSMGSLISSFGQFNYEKYFTPALLANKNLYHSGLPENGYYHVAIEDKSDQVVVTARQYPAFFVVTNFAFFFILGLGVIVLFLAITGIVSWINGIQLNYSSRIQLYVYLSFFFPLLAVSITTLSLISRSDERQLIREYGERAQILSERISSALPQFQSGNENPNDFQNRIAELAKLATVDASVYDEDGSMVASSQPAIFENHLVSYLINRDAWTAIVKDKDNSFIANESIGKLHYNCSYAPIKSPETGKLMGVLSIPFFSSAASLERSQINVVANILTVFVIVFILFSFLSFIVTTGLTFPLRFITRSLRKTTLDDTNQLMVWNSNDEIGMLANEYNRMVQNLEHSKTELLRSQKESAWREIAKQVAHEIKNPLTPMKLTLQQWEQSLSNGQISPEQARKSIGILLTQLETLNEIAGSFSAFARMPTPILERVELLPLLKQIVGLHANAEGGKVAMQQESTRIFILGDEQLLSRIFSNLILNALQSGTEGKPVTVLISVTVHDKTCRIEVRDDGQGIEEGIRERVFLPHFTTKKSGSGLGLAIVWQGIELSGGRIWFETETGRGTAFFIEFPLADRQ